jgi:hypothetical protein
MRGDAAMKNSPKFYLPAEKLAPNLYVYENHAYSCTLDFRASRSLHDTGLDLTRCRSLSRHELLNPGPCVPGSPDCAASICEHVAKGGKVLLEFSGALPVLENEINADNFAVLLTRGRLRAG